MEKENDQEDNFRALLKKAAMETPNRHFTENVMRKIDLEVQLAAAAEEAALKALLKSVPAGQPSAAFTANVLRAVQPAPAIQYRPIISKKAWYWIAAVAIVFITVCFGFSGETPDQPSNVIGFIDQAARSTFIISDKMKIVPELYSLAIIGLASLMLIDYFIRSKTTKLARS